MSILFSVFYDSGCKLNNSKVDRCMTKDQVAFKFHECPSGEDSDSKGILWFIYKIHDIDEKNLTYNNIRLFVV